MKRKILLALLLPFLTYHFDHSLAQNLNLERSFNNSNIFSPYDIYVLNETTIITVELSNKFGVLNILDLKTGKIMASQPAGRGPGELAQTGKKFITKTDEDYVWVWDNGRKRAFLYDNSLNYITDIISDDKSVSDAIYLNDSTVVVRKLFRSKVLVCLNKLQDRRISAESFYCLNSDYTENLSLVKDNFMLNQGAMMRYDGKVYLGFDFSSTIVTIDGNTNIDTLATPYYIPFPKYQHRKGNTFESPDHGKFPMATINIGSNTKYVFVLYSGIIFESNLLKQFTGFITGKLAHEMEKSDNTYQLYVFDRETGDFLKKLELPEMAKAISATEEYLIALSLVDKEYVINKYKIE